MGPVKTMALLNYNPAKLILLFPVLVCLFFSLLNGKIDACLGNAHALQHVW